MKWVFILSFTLTLIGCSSISTSSRVIELRESSYATCQTSSSSEIERVKCINRSYLKISKKYGVPYEDITEISNAVRLALAKKVEARAITKKEAKIAMAGAGYILEAEDENRRYAKGAYPKEQWQNQKQLIGKVNNANIPIQCNKEKVRVLCK